MLPALFVSLVQLVAAAKKGKCLGRCGDSSKHTKNLSNLYSLDIYGSSSITENGLAREALMKGKEGSVQLTTLY
jgi:hypothetical protein